MDDKTIPFNPDLKKETKHYQVSYHPPKGERVKLNISTEHPPGSPAFVNHVHLEAKKLGHKVGSVGATQEVLHLKPSEMVESGTPHSDLAAEMVQSIKQKSPIATKMGKALFDKCSDLMKKYKNPLKVGAAPRGKIVSSKEGDMLHLFDPMFFHKPKSSVTEFLAHEDKIKDKIEEPKKEVIKCEDATLYTVEKTEPPVIPGSASQALEGGISSLPQAKKEVEYDPKELAMGIEIEMEHTNDKEVAKKIAMDHLAEVKDYYSRTKLKEKEEQAKKEGMHTGIEKSIDPEDLHERFPTRHKAPITSGPGSKVPKPPLMFEFDKPAAAFKRGDPVEFISPDTGKPSVGHVEDLRGEKVHIREAGSEIIHRVPLEHVKKYMGLAKSYILSKSISYSWMEALSKEFETLAKSYGIEYKYISMPSGDLHYNLFKIGPCKVIHKAMGKLIDVKISFTHNSIEEQRSLAKTLFYKLLAYYKRDAIAKNYEIYELSDSFGIFESDESLTKACDILKARSGWWGQGGPTASGQKISSAAGTSVLDYMNRKYSQKLRRKQHPRAYKKKMSPALRYLQRHYRYLFGAEKPVAVQSADVKKSLKLTGFGKQMTKAFGMKFAPKTSVGIKVAPKKPSMSLGAPKMAKPISAGIKMGTKMSLASPKPKMNVATPKLKV